MEKKLPWLVVLMNKECCAAFNTSKAGTEPAGILPTTGPMVQEGAVIWREFQERPQVMLEPECELQCRVTCRTVFSLHQTPNKTKKWEIEVRKILAKMETFLQSNSHWNNEGRDSHWGKLLWSRFLFLSFSFLQVQVQFNASVQEHALCGTRHFLKEVCCLLLWCVHSDLKPYWSNHRSQSQYLGISITHLTFQNSSFDFINLNFWMLLYFSLITCKYRRMRLH